MHHIRSATARARIRRTLLGGVLGCGVLVTIGTPAMERDHASTPRRTVYTPVVLRRNLTRAPAAWLGRAVWVRARPVPTFAWTCRHDYICLVRQPSLADPTVDAADARLPLQGPADTPLVALARQVPLLTRLVGPPLALPWGQVALYHIQLAAPPACADPSCVVAELVPMA